MPGARHRGRKAALMRIGHMGHHAVQGPVMSAKVLPFPIDRRAAIAPSAEQPDAGMSQPVAAPCRFTPEARNALNGLTYARPRWGVRFEEHLGDGCEWAAIYDIGGNGYAFVFVTAEPHGRLGLYDVSGEPLLTYETPAELVAAFRRCF